MKAVRHLPRGLGRERGFHVTRMEKGWRSWSPGQLPRCLASGSLTTEVAPAAYARLLLVKVSTGWGEGRVVELLVSGHQGHSDTLVFSAQGLIMGKAALWTQLTTQGSAQSRKMSGNSGAIQSLFFFFFFKWKFEEILKHM